MLYIDFLGNVSDHATPRQRDHARQFGQILDLTREQYNEQQKYASDPTAIEEARALYEKKRTLDAYLTALETEHEPATATKAKEARVHFERMKAKAEERHGEDIQMYLIHFGLNEAPADPAQVDLFLQTA